jgi:hypothetical protein
VLTGERQKSSFVSALLPPKIIAKTIFLWYGSIASIPAPFKLCNGLNGTPDLRNLFVYGAAVPGATGGAIEHTHPFTSNGHYHIPILGFPGSVGGGWPQNWGNFSNEVLTGTTDLTNNLPPYKALCYIMY